VRKARELYTKCIDQCRIASLGELGEAGAVMAAEAAERLSALDQGGCSIS